MRSRQSDGNKHFLATILLSAFSISICVAASPATAEAPPSEIEEAVATALEQTAAGATAPRILHLTVGDVEPISAPGLVRVAVGDPQVADVVVTEDELLIRAERPGSTTLIVWDADGQHQWDVIVERATSLSEDQQRLRRLLNAEGFAPLELRREGEQLYLSGRINTQQEEERLVKLLDIFPSVVNLVQRALATEQAAPLVELEVRVIEVSRDVEQNLGVDWQDQLTVEETGAPTTTTIGDFKQRLETLIRVGALKRTVLQAVLNQLLKEGKARVLAAPNLVTLSGKPATTFLGGQIPIITATSVSAGTVTQNIEFKDIGTRLTITPTVSADREKISSQFESELRSVDKANAILVSGITVPGFKVRQTKTEVISRPEETIVIAGLLQDEESEVAAKVPKLSRAPLIGRFFRNTNYKSTQTELLVLVTPSLPKGHLVTERHVARAEEPSEPARAQSPAAAFRVANVPEPLAPAAPAPAADPVTAYARQVQELVADGLAVPPESAADRGAVRLQVRLLADGSLEHVEVVESSGDQALDDIAQTAVVRQDPYPAFPASLTQSELSLEFPIIFNPG